MPQNKIDTLRKTLKAGSINGFVIPSNDEFQSEYVPEHLNRLKFFTGFTGSNGVAIVTDKSAVFYTDGRYTLQAEKQLGKHYKILDMNKKESCDWFNIGLKKGDILGYDPHLHTHDNLAYYQKMADRYGFKLKAVKNLVDKMWFDKPKPAGDHTFELDIKYTGMSSADKIKAVIASMDKDAQHLFISMPESICWLLNIRGSDVLYTPFVLSYALLSRDGSVVLFTDPSKINFKIKKLSVKKLSDVGAHLKSIKGKVQMDTAKVAVSLIKAAGKNTVLAKDPIEKLKAIKNETEADGFRKCHITDGVAVTKFLYWLFNEAGSITEIDAEEKLLEFRKLGKDFVYHSFATISAYGANASVIHYKSSPKTNTKIGRDNFYLLDSGGQYYSGTTDVTRTVHLGKPTEAQKKHFTLVLQGHIRIAMAKFPTGTTGAHIDVLARGALWQQGLDYGHGTGHGVGHFLSVHEGPARISKAAGPAIEPGMVLSNEPGFYVNGEFGIRIENLVICRKAKFDGFLEFENLTCIPIQTSLIKWDLLSSTEKEYVISYNKWVAKILAKHLSKDERKWVDGF